jgi:hypothetical protein
MRAYVYSAFLGFLVLGLTATEARAQFAVETVSATATLAVPLPGTSIGPEIEFAGITIITSLDFTPGDVLFEGQPVDFDGTEASFLASSYSGLAVFPVNAGPATVPVTGVGAITGAATVSATALIPEVDLGPNFQVNRLDVTYPQGVTVTANTPNWSSGLVPELNGAEIDLEGVTGVFNVDAVNGIVDFNFFGTIFAPSPPAVPSLPIWGVVLLATGILGMAVLLLRRRRSV